MFPKAVVNIQTFHQKNVVSLLLIHKKDIIFRFRDLLKKYVAPQKIAKPKEVSNTEEIHDIQIAQHNTGPKRILFCPLVIQDLGVFNPQTNTFVPLTTWQCK